MSNTCKFQHCSNLFLSYRRYIHIRYDIQFVASFQTNFECYPVRAVGIEIGIKDKSQFYRIIKLLRKRQTIYILFKIPVGQGEKINCSKFDSRCFVLFAVTYADTVVHHCTFTNSQSPRNRENEKKNKKTKNKTSRGKSEAFTFKVSV